MNNMGSMTRKAAKDFAKLVLSDFPGWMMVWTTAAPSICIHYSKKILIYNKLAGRYPWEVKEAILHEAAHINTLAHDQVHGSLFYKEYIRLLQKFML